MCCRAWGLRLARRAPWGLLHVITHPTPQSAPWWPRRPRWPRRPNSIHGPLAQVREAYLQFMISVATMLRKDKKLPKDNKLVQKDMTQVLELETHLANVRRGRGPGQGSSARLWPPTPRDPSLHAGHSAPGGETRRHGPVPQDEPERPPAQVFPEGEAGVHRRPVPAPARA